MTTSYCMNRFQTDRNLRRSKENIEIVPQETCEQYESPESVLTECATSQTPTTILPGIREDTGLSTTVISCGDSKV